MLNNVGITVWFVIVSNRSVVSKTGLAWAEVCGRSYGGGVLELEPREAEELPIFYKDNIEIDMGVTKIHHERPQTARGSW
jgi:hypothetical protein